MMTTLTPGVGSKGQDFFVSESDSLDKTSHKDLPPQTKHPMLFCHPGCFVLGGRNGMGCFVRGDKNSM